MENQDAIKQFTFLFSHLGHGVCGSPRIYMDFKENGYQISESFVAKLMRELEMTWQFIMKFVTTTNSDHNKPIYNLLNCQFDVEELNIVWVTDITYVNTLDGWVYLESVMYFW